MSVVGARGDVRMVGVEVVEEGEVGTARLVGVLRKPIKLVTVAIPANNPKPANNAIATNSCSLSNDIDMPIAKTSADIPVTSSRDEMLARSAGTSLV